MTKHLNTYKVFFIVMGTVCAAAIAVNMLVRQGPVRDANAAEDIRAISGAIDGYASSQSRLPTSLSDVSGLSSQARQRLHDYEYIPGGSMMYQICATFNASSSDQTSRPYPVYGNTDPGTHGRGRQCFSYTANVMGQPVPLSK